MKRAKVRSRTQRGSGCSCANSMFGTFGSRQSGSRRSGSRRSGGYRATKKNLETLRRWRRGESIGFTATSSLKAKGLIPRTSKELKGKYVVSPRYATVGTRRNATKHS